MTENKEKNKAEVKETSKAAEKNNDQKGATAPKSVYATKKTQEKRARKTMRGRRTERIPDEYEQRIIDIARVTRVMAGGKRMRFRACVAVGNKKGKVGIGLDKGADVTIAVTKAVNKAKKQIIDVPIINATIPHEIYQKYGAAKVLLKPARRGKGVIAGGAVRIVLELSGIKNITSKILGTNNKVTVAKATIRALDSIKKVETKSSGKRSTSAKDKEVRNAKSQGTKKTVDKKENKK